ncbi:hypothetical protein D3C75_1200510 [compost metagenome]
MVLVTNWRITEDVPRLPPRLCALDLIRLIIDKTGTTLQCLEHPWTDIVPNVAPQRIEAPAQCLIQATQQRHIGIVVNNGHIGPPDHCAGE